MRVMRSSSEGFAPQQRDYVRQSEICATCHTLITTALGPDGESIGALPEQVPYQEWLHSDYKGQRSCQSCHMPELTGAIPITRVFGAPRDGVSRHVFVGSNFFMVDAAGDHQVGEGPHLFGREFQIYEIQSSTL